MWYFVHVLFCTCYTSPNIRCPLVCPQQPVIVSSMLKLHVWPLLSTGFDDCLSSEFWMSQVWQARTTLKDSVMRDAWREKLFVCVYKLTKVCEKLSVAVAVVIKVSRCKTFSMPRALVTKLGGCWCLNSSWQTSVPGVRPLNSGETVLRP